jgi:Alpha-lytic protease prodomain/Trypsin
MRAVHFPSPRLGLTVALTLSAAMIVPFAAHAAPPQDPSAPAVSKELLSAMRRDLGLDAQQATRYLDAERSAMARTPEVMKRLGAAYAGSWIEYGKDGRFRLVVAATNADAAAQARDFGAETRIVPRSLAQLDAAKSRLDRIGKQRRTDPGVHVWYVDVKTNQVVIEAEYKAQDAALDLVARSGVDASTVRFKESNGRPLPTNIIGGEAFNSCSIGFPVTRGTDTGFATAGHCGGVGTPATGGNGVAQGVFDGSTFPGADSAWVRITNPGPWPLQNWVTNYAGGTVPINGSTQAPVGAAICRSGRTTGYRCGTVSANNVTVNYAAGAVFGLTSTSACVGFGDSGGAYITPAGQAQGVTSGGLFFPNTNDNCASNPPVSYHQPIVPLLNQYGLTLFTGAVVPTPPTITSLACYSGQRLFECSLSYTSTSPSTVAWSGATGTGSGGNGYGDFFGRCTVGQRYNITATVSNSVGTVSRTTAFTCSSGPIP